MFCMIPIQVTRSIISNLRPPNMCNNGVTEFANLSVRSALTYLTSAALHSTYNNSLDEFDHVLEQFLRPVIGLAV
jgi:hypothetical protein